MNASKDFIWSMAERAIKKNEVASHLQTHNTMISAHQVDCIKYHDLCFDFKSLYQCCGSSPIFFRSESADPVLQKLGSGSGSYFDRFVDVEKKNVMAFSYQI